MSDLCNFTPTPSKGGNENTTGSALHQQGAVLCWPVLRAVQTAVARKAPSLRDASQASANIIDLETPMPICIPGGWVGGGGGVSEPCTWEEYWGIMITQNLKIDYIDIRIFAKMCVEMNFQNKIFKFYCSMVTFFVPVF